MKNKINKIKIIVTIGLLFMTVALVSAANIGVSPANVDFKGVLRNGYAERPVTITIDSESPVKAKAVVRGEIKEWITLSEETLSVSRGQPARIIVSVQPPADTPNGNYQGFIRINSSQLGGAIPGHATGLILPVLDLVVNVEVTDKEVIECSAKEFEVNSVEEGEDIVFTLSVQNQGNVRFAPEIRIDVWDQDSLNILKQESYDRTEILPTKEEKLIIRVPSKDLPLGQFWVDVSAIECFSQRTLTFDVLEEGALRASVILEKIIVSSWVDLEDIVPITASFKNTGEKAVEASFSGKILFKNKIVQLLESDREIFTPIDGQEAFQFFFTPRDAGRYVVSGRVFYDGKRTYEQSAVVNVRPGSAVWGSILKTVTYLILLIIIAILLYKVRNERRSYLRKLRLRK